MSTPQTEMMTMTMTMPLLETSGHPMTGYDSEVTKIYQVDELFRLLEIERARRERDAARDEASTSD